ncbi:MAG: FMN-binding protein [Prevotellaceae bacterium]|nr:FMN-binding protein [Candidatus Faecinaster equi]
MNTNSNTYIIIYAAIMVVIVAFLLAFVGKTLQPLSDKNVEIDTKKHILNSLNMRDVAKTDVENVYKKILVEEKQEDNVEYKVFNVDGAKKYVVTVKGQGLWGGISGYIALDEDAETIYGADFQHESETAGLGALIADKPFQESFIGKKLFDGDDKSEIALSVVKQGKAGNMNPNNVVDGLTGATLTSNGVDAMLKTSLGEFVKVINK